MTVGLSFLAQKDVIPHLLRNLTCLGASTLGRQIDM